MSIADPMKLEGGQPNLVPNILAAYTKKIGFSVRKGSAVGRKEELRNTLMDLCA